MVSVEVRTGIQATGEKGETVATVGGGGVMQFLKFLLRLAISPLVYVAGCLMLLLVVGIWVIVDDGWEIRLVGGAGKQWLT